MVCSPALLKKGRKLERPADLNHFPLLHDDSYETWERWLAAAGVKDVNPRRGVICGDRNSMLQAALEGQGVAIASGVFVANELAAGRLMQVFSDAVRSEFAIYAVCVPRRLSDPLVAGALEWLAAEAVTSPDAHTPKP